VLRELLWTQEEDLHADLILLHADNNNHAHAYSDHPLPGQAPEVLKPQWISAMPDTRPEAARSALDVALLRDCSSRQAFTASYALQAMHMHWLES
jgi:hypothetical protein